MSSLLVLATRSESLGGSVAKGWGSGVRPDIGADPQAGLDWDDQSFFALSGPFGSGSFSASDKELHIDGPPSSWLNGPLSPELSGLFDSVLDMLLWR